MLSKASAWSWMPCGHCPEILNSFTSGFVRIESDKQWSNLQPGLWMSLSLASCLTSPGLVVGHSHPWGLASLSPPPPLVAAAHSRRPGISQTPSAKTHFMGAQQGQPLVHPLLPYKYWAQPHNKAAIPCLLCVGVVGPWEEEKSDLTPCLGLKHGL